MSVDKEIERTARRLEELKKRKANKAILLMGNKTAIVDKVVYYKDEELNRRTKMPSKISKEL